MVVEPLTAGVEPNVKSDSHEAVISQQFRHIGRGHIEKSHDLCKYVYSVDNASALARRC